MNSVKLKLFVTGQTPRTEHAIANLQQLCEQELGADYELAIVDVLEHPQLAEENKILATPTLVREHPTPRLCIVGDLSDAQQVLLLLGLHPRKPEGEQS